MSSAFEWEATASIVLRLKVKNNRQHFLHARRSPVRDHHAHLQELLLQHNLILRTPSKSSPRPTHAPAIQCPGTGIISSDKAVSMALFSTSSWRCSPWGGIVCCGTERPPTPLAWESRRFAWEVWRCACLSAAPNSCERRRQNAALFQKDSPISRLLVFFHLDHVRLLVPAVVMQMEDGDHEVSPACEPHTERPPQNAPRRHEDTECLFDFHSQLAQVEVEGVLVPWQTFSRLRREQLLADRVCRIPDHVVAVWKARSYLRQERLSPC